MGDLPVVDHAAEFFHRAVHEGLLFHAQLGLGLLEQLMPVRLAGEQLAFETYRARFQRGLLGLGKLGRHLGEHLQQRRADLLAAEGGHQQRHRNRQLDHQQNECGPWRAGDEADHDGGDHRGDRPCAQAGAMVGTGAGGNERRQQSQDHGHLNTSLRMTTLRIEHGKLIRPPHHGGRVKKARPRIV